jgi:hypothetical protein
LGAECGFNISGVDFEELPIPEAEEYDRVYAPNGFATWFWKNAQLKQGHRIEIKSIVAQDVVPPEFYYPQTVDDALVYGLLVIGSSEVKEGIHKNKQEIKNPTINLVNLIENMTYEEIGDTPRPVKLILED